MISMYAGPERSAKRDQLGDPLQVLHRYVDFASLAKAIDEKLALGKSGRGGRPPYSTETMIRILVLQQLYNLSDEAMEYQLLDRTSFLRFTDLEYSGRVPDAKTIWVWRERLKAKDLIGDISQAVGEQLTRAGFIARGGQIIDATVISAPIQHASSEEKAQIKQGQVPSDWSPAKRAQKDTQARWTKKYGAYRYGYKLHANTDRRWGFIRQHEVTPAHVHDTNVFESLLEMGNTSKAVYADGGYAVHGREQGLIDKGYRPCLHRKGEAGRALSERQKQRNHRLSKQRCYVEHAFARLHHMGGKQLRTIGLSRAKIVIGLKVVAHNLMRLAQLQHRGVVPV